MGASGSYECATCGGEHPGPPLSYRVPAPVSYLVIPEDERALRCELSSDQCVVDGEHFFVAGNVRIPILGSEETFSWTAWASLSRDNFIRATDLWHTVGRESEPPYFGWLSSELPGYPSTLNLKTKVITQPAGTRPEIELEPTDHPLAVEQRLGITRNRVIELATIVLHGAV
ncbi:MAG: DUF2199 domain-containing protein [Myxococcota bacterium]